MNRESNTYTLSQTCHKLLQKVMLDAFQTECHLVSYPYEALPPIDRGIRNLMWTDAPLPDNHVLFTGPNHQNRLTIDRSNLGFYTLLFYLSADKNSDFISVGPFRAEEFSSDYFDNLIRDLKLPKSKLLILKNFYENLPFVPLASILNVSKDIITHFYPEFDTISPVFVRYSPDNRALHINHEILQKYSIDYSELFQQSLLQFLDVLKTGELSLAQKALNKLIRETNFLTSQNVTECKSQLYTFNDSCQLVLLMTNIHPARILTVSTSVHFDIGNTNNKEVLLAMPYEISRKYCLLVKNNSFPNCSKTTRAVISYIQLHLDEPLSLSLLASHFKKNPTSLSNAFHKEVGICLTDFIQETRINEAIRYFNTTDMSVSEVSLAVGYSDFAYFSRIFRRQTGLSPREYRKSIQ